MDLSRFGTGFRSPTQPTTLPNPCLTNNSELIAKVSYSQSYEFINQYQSEIAL
jgi:hypothetical protein